MNEWTFVDGLSFTLTRFQLFVKICFHLLTNPLKLPETNNLGKIIYYVITTETETHTGSVKKIPKNKCTNLSLRKRLQIMINIINLAAIELNIFELH